MGSIYNLTNDFRNHNPNRSHQDHPPTKTTHPPKTHPPRPTHKRQQGIIIIMPYCVKCGIMHDGMGTKCDRCQTLLVSGAASPPPQKPVRRRRIHPRARAHAMVVPVLLAIIVCSLALSDHSWDVFELDGFEMARYGPIHSCRNTEGGSDYGWECMTTIEFADRVSRLENCDVCETTAYNLRGGHNTAIAAVVFLSFATILGIMHVSADQQYIPHISIAMTACMLMAGVCGVMSPLFFNEVGKDSVRDANEHVPDGPPSGSVPSHGLRIYAYLFFYACVLVEVSTLISCCSCCFGMGFFYDCRNMCKDGCGECHDQCSGRGEYDDGEEDQQLYAVL